MKREEILQFILDAGSDDLGVFGGDYAGGIRIQQIPDEIAPCINDLMSCGKDINSLLEIGSAAGGTAYVFNRFFKPERIVIIDDNLHARHDLRQEILKGIERQEIIGKSRDDEIIKQVTGEFDLLIIDADHSYTGVWADIINYSPFLKQGGFMLLHDSVMPVWDVPKVVAELKEDERFSLFGEYVSKTHPRPCGIAVFRKVK